MGGAKRSGWQVTALGAAMLLGVVGQVLPAAAQNKIVLDEANIAFTGYSAAYVPVRQAVETGEFATARACFTELFPTRKERRARRDEERPDWPPACPIVDRLGIDPLGELVKIPGQRKLDTLLNEIERGTLAHDTLDHDAVVTHLRGAEDLLQERLKHLRTDRGGFMTRMRRGVEDAFTGLGEILGGDDELSKYKGRGYERVLTLNMLTLSYLLQGERSAFNVAKRASLWQNQERVIFEREVADANSRLDSLTGEESELAKILDVLTGRFDQYNDVAVSVPGAFVNPLGFYVSGIAYEFNSYDDPFLIGNARASYGKAFDLTRGYFAPIVAEEEEEDADYSPASVENLPDLSFKGNTFLAETISDLKTNGLRKDKRLVHVLIGEGMAPVRKVLLAGLPYKGTVIPIKFPLMEPEERRIGRIQVLTAGGRRLADLTLLADLEAFVLRDQKDRLPIELLKLFASILRQVGEEQLVERIGIAGRILRGIREANTTPDMRSWSSLPARFHAARFHLSPDIDQIRVVTYAVSGRKLADDIVDLGAAPHNFVYGRAVDRQLQVSTNPTLWIDTRFL